MMEAKRELHTDHDEFDRFVSLIAHELRGPLATLGGYAQLLAKSGDVPHVQARAANAVIAQTRRINLIVDNLLQASRISSRRLRLQREQADLVKLVRQVADQEQETVKGHTFELRVPDRPITGHWDAALIALVLSNLISNAAKFAAHGTKITVVVEQSPGSAVVRVSDRGIGIPPEDRASLFQPYRRPLRTQEYPGIGVGLYVAKGIVEAHFGAIGFDSRQGAGTTFWLMLPR